MPNRVLDSADALVYGDRQDDYGHPGAKYEAVGRTWAALLSAHHGRMIPDIPARLVCVMLASMKHCRDASKPKQDNLADAAGYAELAAWVSEEKDDGCTLEAIRRWWGLGAGRYSRDPESG